MFCFYITKQLKRWDQKPAPISAALIKRTTFNESLQKPNSPFAIQNVLKVFLMGIFPLWPKLITSCVIVSQILSSFPIIFWHLAIPVLQHLSPPVITWLLCIFSIFYMFDCGSDSTVMLIKNKTKCLNLHWQPFALHRIKHTDYFRWQEIFSLSSGGPQSSCNWYFYDNNASSDSVKGVAHCDEPTENNHVNVQLPSALWGWVSAHCLADVRLQPDCFVSPSPL